MSWAGAKYRFDRLRQAGALRKLEKLGFERRRPKLFAARSILLIGSGPSAQPDTLAGLEKQYDTVVALNSARNLIDWADIHSIEFAYRHPEVRQRQLAEIDRLDYAKSLLKPYSLASLPAEDLAFILRKWRENAQAAPPFIAHNNIPARLVVREPSWLTRRNRGPVQWRGSLTLWLDLCWLSGARRIGLVGTDLGTVDRSGNFSDHLTNQTFHGAPGLLGIMARVREAGYLEGVRFEHFHKNDTLRQILGN